jgi:hypothetical protein
MSDSILINPEDLKNKENSSGKYKAKGNLVEVTFESGGRFSLPESMFFEDYSVTDIQEFAVADMDNLLETLVVILDKLKNQDCPISVAKATPNEFLEILIGMNIKFDNAIYKHMWLCNCQLGLHEDEQNINESIINLADLKFRSIEEVDENFQKQYKPIFDKMPDGEFRRYLEERYKNNEVDIRGRTRDDEVSSMQVKEPVNYKNNKNGDIYSFNLMRIENVINAQKMVKDKYRPLLKSLQNRKNMGQSMETFKAEKEEELKKIDRMKAKDIITYSEALALHSVNSVELKDNDEKINAYVGLKRDDYFDLETFLKGIDYGIYYDKKLSCPHCGDSEGRILQQDINPLELLPIDPDSKERGLRGDDRGPNIYFGI